MVYFLHKYRILSTVIYIVEYIVILNIKSHKNNYVPIYLIKILKL